MWLKSKPVSFWAFLALIALVALAWFPATGPFLWFFAVPLLVGPLLVHIFLVALLVEGFTGRVPRILMIVPLAAYGAYYAAYVHQGALIAQKSTDLRTLNPGKVLDFDAKSHSLVTPNALSLVSSYEIPVAYEANKDVKPEGYLSYRLIPRAQCKFPADSQHRIQMRGVLFGDRLEFQQQVCALEFPEAPPYKIVTAVKRGHEEEWGKWGIGEQIIELSVDGAVVGSFRTATVWRMPVMPGLLLGGFLGFGSPTRIDGVPEGIDRQRYDTPESIMLGIRKYAASDLADFRGFEQNAPALARVAEEPNRVENETFAMLKAIVDGQNPKPSISLGFSIAQNPDRLAPFAEAMAKRFVELNQSDSRDVPNRDLQLLALATGIAALPRGAFMNVSELIFAVVQQTQPTGRYARERRWPTLYIRAGDAGATAFEFYKNEFMADNFVPYLRMLPVLAICRIGQADPDTITEMKRRFISSNAGAEVFNDYKSALVVALMKLGEESFLRENTQSNMRARARDWINAVLANKGTTEAGPNNCMAEEWTMTDYLGSAMAPSLQWVNRAWTTRPQNQAN